VFSEKYSSGIKADFKIFEGFV